MQSAFSFTDAHISPDRCQHKQYGPPSDSQSGHNLIYFIWKYPNESCTDHVLNSSSSTPSYLPWFYLFIYLFICFILFYFFRFFALFGYFYPYSLCVYKWIYSIFFLFLTFWSHRFVYFHLPFYSANIFLWFSYVNTKMQA